MFDRSSPFLGHKNCYFSDNFGDFSLVYKFAEINL